MYTDGSAPQPPRWGPELPWAEDPEWCHALDLLDHHYWWEAHEVLEGMWGQLPSPSPLRALCQGLIQACAFRIKRHLGHSRGARTLAGRAAIRLRQAQTGLGSAHIRGVDVPGLLIELDAAAG